MGPMETMKRHYEQRDLQHGNGKPGEERSSVTYPTTCPKK